MSKAFRTILRRLQSARPRSRRQFQARQIDCLEVRILPTAIVAFTGTAMTITGDTTDNNISLTTVGTQLHVDANGGLITVAGSDVPSFDFNLNGAFNLTATFQGGSDTLVVTGPLQLKSVSVSLGDGLLNTFSMTDANLTGKLTVKGGDGTDLVGLTTTSVAGTTSINLGWNTDAVDLIDSTFTGATTINTDLGNDEVIIAGTTNRAKFVGKLTINTGDDADIMLIQKVDTKAVSIDTGDGGDSVDIEDQLLGGGLSVKTGSGEDNVNIVQVVQSGTGANLIDTGSDADIALLSTSSLTGPTTINIGSGTANSLQIDDVTFNNTFTFNSQGAGDTIEIEQINGLAGATTFAKAAKFNFGLGSNVFIGTASTDNKVKFLSTVAFTGRSIISTLDIDPINVSFAVAPTLKNVLIV